MTTKNSKVDPTLRAEAIRLSEESIAAMLAGKFNDGMRLADEAAAVARDAGMSPRQLRTALEG